MSEPSISSSATDPAPRLRGMHLILPYLYMSDADAACTDKAELQRLNIKKIVNCSSSEVDSLFPEDFSYLELSLEDRHDAEPSKHFNEVFDLISSVKDSDKHEKALVFDVNGKNIAPTLVLAYMMMSAKKHDKHLPLAQAIKFVQSKAPGSNPSPQFLAQLVELEVELFEDASVKVRGVGGSGGGSRGRGGRGGKGKRGK